MALTTRQTQNLWKQSNRTRAVFFRKYVREFRRLYKVQGDSILKSYQDNGAISDADLLPKAVQALFVKLYVDTGSAFSTTSFVSLKSGKEVIQTKQITEPPIQTWEQLMANYALQEGSESIVSINSTNLEQAQRIINRSTAQAVELGLGIPETTAFIERNILNEWRKYGKFSAERIARTEVIAASNQGAMLGARSTGLVLQKVWLTALDGRERVTHAQVNGISVDMDKPFEVGASLLMQPGDKRAPAAEVINCRCAVAFQSALTL